MKRFSGWIEDLPGTHWLALVALLWGVPMAGIFVEGSGLMALAALAVPAGLLFGMGDRWRALAGQLPLEIAPHALVERHAESDTYRFRVRLGKGRVMRNPVARISFRNVDGSHEFLSAVRDAPALIGPWTLLIEDPERICVGKGAFSIWVQAREGEQVWEASANWERAAVKEGRFVQSVALSGGSVVWAPEWYAIAADEKNSG